MLLPPKRNGLDRGVPPGVHPRSQVIELGDPRPIGLGDSPLRPRQSIVISAQLHHLFGDLDELVRRRQVASEQRG